MIIMIMMMLMMLIFWNHVGSDVVGDDSNCDDVGDDVGDEDSYHAVTLNKCYYLTYMR